LLVKNTLLHEIISHLKIDGKEILVFP